MQLSSTTASIRIPFLANCNTIDTDANGVASCGTDEGGVGGAQLATSSWDYWKDQRNFFSTSSADYWETQQAARGGTFTWLPTSWGNSTSTTLGFLNGFLSTASSTITGVLHADGTIDFQNLFTFDAEEEDGVQRLRLQADGANDAAELFLQAKGNANSSRLTITPDSSNANYSFITLESNGTSQLINSGNAGNEDTLPFDIRIDDVAALTVATTRDITAQRNFTVIATSTFSTTTASMINGMIVVDGVHYPQTGAGIQAAINDQAARGGGVVHLPVATYSLTAPIVVPKDSHVRLMGAKSIKNEAGIFNGGAVLKADAAIANMIDVSGNYASSNTDLNHDFSIEHIFLEGNGGNATTCVLLHNADLVKITDFRMRGCINNVKGTYAGVHPPTASTVPGGFFIERGTMGVEDYRGGSNMDFQDQTQIRISNVWMNGIASSSLRIASTSKLQAEQIEFNAADVGVLFQDSLSRATNDVIISDSVFSVGTGNKVVTSSLVHGSSNRNCFHGNTYPQGTADSMTGIAGCNVFLSPLSTINNGHLVLMPNGTGNVGIGTTSPQSLLHVSGASTILKVESTNSTTPGIEFLRASGVTSNRFINSAGALLFQRSTNQFSTVAATDLTISATGLVGIGTSTPGTLLSVNGIVNLHTATSTFYGTGGINLAAGCFAINGTCVSGSGVADGTWSTTSAEFFVNGSTTIPKTYTANAFTANQTFGGLGIFDRTGSASFSNTTESIASLSTGNLAIMSRGFLDLYIDSNNNGTDALRIFGNTSSNELFRFTDTGLAGFGTTSPYAQISVEGISALGNSATAGRFIATTSVASVFPYASTTALSGTTFCIGADCRTSWPTGAGADYPFTPGSFAGVGVSATSTGLWLRATTPWSMIASTTLADWGSFGSTTPMSNTAFVVGTSTWTGIHVNSNTGKIGFGCVNTSQAKAIFDCGTNANVNPNIKFLVQDPTDARMGVAAADIGVFMKSATGAIGGGIYAYNYALGAARSLILNEFGGNVGVATTTPTSAFSVSGTSGSTVPIASFASSSNVTYLSIGSNGTTTITGPLSATSTTFIYSTAAGKGGSIILEDVDAAGCTELSALNGVVSAAIVTCPTQL